MKIIIAGNGKVGNTLARQLTEEGHDLTIIEMDKRVLEAAVEQLDVMAIQGNCASMSVLLEAGVEEAELLIAVTNYDEVNLLCCMTAQGLNSKLHTIARIRNPDYTQQVAEMPGTFHLAMTVNPEKQAAQELERLLKFPGFLRRDTFAKGRTEIVELRVDSKSKLRDVALIDLPNVVKCKILVCAVLRNGQALVSNSGSFVLQEGDRIFVTAPTANLALLLKNLGIITRRVRRVMLCGGDRIGWYLAKLLEKDNITVEILENNEKRCRILAEQLPQAEVILADCTNRDVLESEDIAECDAVITLTGLDEMNMIVSLYATSRGVPQVITKLGRNENSQLADSLELGSVICPRELCSNNIVRYVRAMQNQTGAAVSVHSIADGKAEAVEFLVDKTTKNCGKPLKELKLKQGLVVTSITHGAKTEIPNGDSCFLPGDTVVVVTGGRGVLHQMNDIFA